MRELTVNSTHNKIRSGLHVTFKKNIEQSDGLSLPTFTHDPEYISFRGWMALLSIEGKMLEENRKNETALARLISLT